MCWSSTRVWFDVPVASEAAAPKFVLDTDVATSISFFLCLLTGHALISESRSAPAPQLVALATKVTTSAGPPSTYPAPASICVCGAPPEGGNKRRRRISHVSCPLLLSSPLPLPQSLSFSSSRNKVGLLILAPESKKGAVVRACAPGRAGGRAHHCATSFMLTLISFITFATQWALPSFGHRGARPPRNARS